MTTIVDPAIVAASVVGTVAADAPAQDPVPTQDPEEPVVVVAVEEEKETAQEEIVQEETAAAAVEEAEVAAPPAQQVEDEPVPMQQGIVKLVQGGDSVLMHHPTRAIERSFSFAYISSPRLARKPGDTPDEPFAFEAREFIRKRCIGKGVVEFQINYIIPKTKREFGTIWVNNENLSLALVQAGLAKVRELRNDSTDLHKELWEAAQAAQSAGKGVWTQNEKVQKSNIRNIKWEDDYDAEKAYNDWKGKIKKAVVEFVLSGSTLKLHILPTYHNVTLQMSGIQLLKSDAKKEDPELQQFNLTSKQIQAFNSQAKQFVESKLLMRDVFVIFEGVDKYGNLQGSILQTENSQNAFQELLLEQGFARVMDFSMAKTKFAPRLRSAENSAKTKRVRIFSNYTAAETQQKAETKREEISGTVIEIVSADTIIVLNKNTNTPVKIGLSSIRTPRWQIGRRKGEETKIQSEPFGFDAKEYVRKALIGRNVTVQIDYAREMKFGGGGGNNNASKPEGEAAKESSSNEKRLFGTVFGQGKNINLELVKEGLATVVRHRANDPKSSFIDLLYSAENTAKEGRKGAHGSTDKSTAPKLNDLTSSTPKQAQQYFMFFENKGRVRATIEKVFTGSRFKLIVPSTSIVLNFALQGVIAPSFNRSRKEGQPDTFAQESLEFVRRMILQRDVDVEFDSVDKTGTYIGSIYVGKKNLSMEILERGFARPQLPVLEKIKHSTDLKNAFERAKAAKRGVWSVDPPANKWNRPAEAEAEAEGEGEYDDEYDEDEDDEY